MNQQFLSVLFCALIGSTLGHEFLRANELTHKGKHHSRSHSSLSQYRDNNNESCSYVCPVPNPSGDDNGDSSIRFIINKEVSVVAVVNVTAAVALAVDLQFNLVVLFNGNTGVTILIDLKAETGIYLAEGSCDKLWLASQISFTEYLLALGSLQNVRNFTNGQTFKFKSASKQVVVAIGVIISSLGSELAERININAQAALSIVVVISKVLIATLGGSLSIIIKKVEAVELIIQGGLLKLVALLRGLDFLAKKIVGGLEALLVADINFKLSLILAAASGLEAIVALLGQVASKVDLSKVLRPILESPEAFLEVVVSFEQGLYKGISGIIAVVYNVLLLTSHKISLSVFIDVLIQVAASGGAVTEERLSGVIDSVINLIQTQTNQFKSSESWQGLLTFFNNFKSGKLVVAGIDISAIVSSIISAAGKVSLGLVVTILLKLSAVVGFAVAIANLYLRLVFFVISGQGIVHVLQLLPSIKLDLDFTSNKSIVVQILKSVNVVKVLKYILTLDIIGLITNLPILGDIFVALGEALAAAGKKSEDLKSALKGSDIIKTLIGWVRFGLGLGGGAAPSGEIGGQSFIGGGASINIDISISVLLGSSSSWNTNAGGNTNVGSGGNSASTSGINSASSSGESSASVSEGNSASTSGGISASASEGISASTSGGISASTSGGISASASGESSSGGGFWGKLWGRKGAVTESSSSSSEISVGSGASSSVTSSSSTERSGKFTVEYKQHGGRREHSEDKQRNHKISAW